MSEVKPSVRSQLPIEALIFEIPEACEILRTSRTELYKAFARGDLKSIKNGRRRQVAGSEIARRVKYLASLAS